MCKQFNTECPICSTKQHGPIVPCGMKPCVLEESIQPVECKPKSVCQGPRIGQWGYIGRRSIVGSWGGEDGRVRESEKPLQREMNVKGFEDVDLSDSKVGEKDKKDEKDKQGKGQKK